MKVLISREDVSVTIMMNFYASKSQRPKRRGVLFLEADNA